MIKKIIKRFLNQKYKNAEMVSYWKTQDSVEAKVTLSKEGHYVMYMQGEKYPFPGYPRGSLLFGQLSKLKHEIKNQIFNDTWAKLENKEENIIENLKKEVLPKIFELGEKTRYDMVPFERMVPPVKEIWRAMSLIPNEKAQKLKEIICFILQEDDAYRMRFQYIVKFFPFWFKPTIKHFDYALSMLEHAEMIGDMKERIRLLRRVLMFVLQDEQIRKCFEIILKEMDWKKLKLSKADKYFFRAKYFKVDYPEYTY